MPAPSFCTLLIQECSPAVAHVPQINVSSELDISERTLTVHEEENASESKSDY